MPNVDPVLVDTHALLWWQAGGQRLSTAAARRIEGADVVYFSTITCWEVAMLVERGRVGLDRPVSAWLNDLLAITVADVAELTPAIAVAAGHLRAFHGDPADRIIYATAGARKLPLVTKDARLRDVAAANGDVATIW